MAKIFCLRHGYRKGERNITGFCLVLTNFKCWKDPYRDILLVACPPVARTRGTENVSPNTDTWKTLLQRSHAVRRYNTLFPQCRIDSRPMTYAVKHINAFVTPRKDATIPSRIPWYKACLYEPACEVRASVQTFSERTGERQPSNGANSVEEKFAKIWSNIPGRYPRNFTLDGENFLRFARRY